MHKIINKTTMTHTNCAIAKGIRTFKCLTCGNEGTNYCNGIEICRECCEINSICRICGDFGKIEE